MHLFYGCYVLSGQVAFGIEVERILHFPRRVVLRLEKGIEIPERALHYIALDLCESHLKEKRAHLVDEALVRMQFCSVDRLYGRVYVVWSYFCGSPGAACDNGGCELCYFL